MSKTVIIDYGMGNLYSIQNMAKYLGHECLISDDRKEIGQADKLILPGVGNFGMAMKELRSRDLISVLNYRVRDEKVPVMGICLGMQLLTDFSEEGQCEGIGWIPAQTRRFAFKGDQLKIPHMGWDYAKVNRKAPIVSNVEERDRYYFVHSYYVTCDRDEFSVAKTEYGIIFDSIIQNGNVVGTQFHPEKSHQFGMKILKNFLEKY